MLGGDTIRTVLLEWTTGTSTEEELSSWCANTQNSLRDNRKTGPTFKIKAPPCSYLVTEAICHWFLRFRDNVVGSLQNTCGFQMLLLALPWCFHHQLCLVESVWGGRVRSDGLDDDAVAGAEAVSLRKVNQSEDHKQRKKERKEQRTQTDRQTVEDNVFVGCRRRACRQGNCAVVGETEGQALTGRGLEVVGPWSASGLQVKWLDEEKQPLRILRFPFAAMLS